MTCTANVRTFIVRVGSTNPRPERVHAEIMRALAHSFQSVEVERIEERKV